MTETQRTVAGSFADYDQAQRCVGALEQAGFTHAQIGVLRKGVQGESVEHVHSTPGVGTGAVTGGLIGAAAAFLIPGAGPVIGAGILGSTLLGVLAGGATGGVVSAFTHAGLAHHEAEYYGNSFEQGHTVVTVRAEGRELDAERILSEGGANTMPAETGVVR